MVLADMADNQRIHPVVDVNVEVPPPSRPLAPEGPPKRLFRSENSDLVMQQPAPISRTIPVMQSKPPKKRSCWCKCLCWTIGLLLLLVIIIGAAAGILYLVFKPKLPNYSVDNLRISDLRLNFDLSLYASFNVRITLSRSGAKVLPGSPE